MFSLVVLGGAVRLTGSGLSMVDWRPLGGIIPPLDETAWRHAFESYRQFPEFRLVNPDMSVAGFRFLFWMEYAHRLLGRVTGLVFLLPFLFFLWRKRVPRAVAGGLWGLFFLGALQGLLGWYMVKSGLADTPTVSPYRLLMHFALAVVIYIGLLRVAVGLGRAAPPGGTANMLANNMSANNMSPNIMSPNIMSPNIMSPNIMSLNIGGKIALGMVLLMLCSGALVAGTRAGHAYNTWPKMGRAWVPESLLALRPWWLNFLENPVAIQFAHRWLAVLALIAVSLFALRLAARRPLAAGILLAVVVAQIALGIATLVYGVPVALGVAHQAGAMLLLTMVVAVADRKFYYKTTSYNHNPPETQ